jgi:hypothetical protein
MTDWAAWGTTVGTLVLAGATFAAIRSSNRSARIAERSLLAGLQPMLVVARRDDPVEEVQFADGQTFKAGPASALFHNEGDVIYMAVPLRNAGAGIAYLYGYRLEAEAARTVQAEPLDSARHRRRGDAPDPASFSVQQRDVYIAPGETGFWQAALRDPTAPIYASTLEALRTLGRITIDLLYGDMEGGQRTITRVVCLPGPEQTWRCDVAHHWRGAPSKPLREGPPRW